MEENDLIRVRIDESKQKEIFTKFIDDFNKDFSLASSYLGINNFSLSRYKRAVSKYIPKDIFLKVVEHLNLEQPDILYSGTLNEIRVPLYEKSPFCFGRKIWRKLGERALQLEETLKVLD